MTRSIWKNVYVDSTLLYNMFYSNTSKGSLPYQTNSRGSTILCEFVGKTVGVHNGKQYFFININKLMSGYKLGSFVHTKKLCIYRKLKKGKKYIKKQH